MTFGRVETIKKKVFSKISKLRFYKTAMCSSCLFFKLYDKLSLKVHLILFLPKVFGSADHYCIINYKHSDSFTVIMCFLSESKSGISSSKSSDVNKIDLNLE